MRRNKKAEISMQIIVMAAVALLVLIVLSYMILGGAKGFGEGSKSCLTRAQKPCQKEPCSPDELQIQGVKCPSGEYCCAALS